MKGKLKSIRSNMPKVGRNSITKWQDKLTLVKVTQVMSEGDTANIESYTDFKGTIQPLTGKQLDFKPAGQHAWGWWQIHCLQSVKNITVNDAIIFDGKRFKVMEIIPYSFSGYVEYHVVEKFND